jgi:hypothetical protein
MVVLAALYRGGMDLDPSQLRALARLPGGLLADFLRAGCAQPEADLLDEILQDAEAGLINEAEARNRVDDFYSTERTKATWTASVGWAGGIAVAGADVVQMANEASATVLAHPAIVGSMDILGGCIALAAGAVGAVFSWRLRRLPSRRKVLRACARSLVRGVN